MLMDAAEFLIKKAIEAKYRGKKVDQQIGSCYIDFLMNSSVMDDSLLGYKEMIDQMVSAINKFDKTGNPENMYVSFCLFFDKILTKKEYYLYADQMLKNIVTYSELSTYLDYSAFKSNIMSDFDPLKVDFQKTNTMIYKDFNSLKKHIDIVFNKAGGGIRHDKTTSFIVNKASAYVNTDKKIHAYAFDPHLNVTSLPDSAVAVNKEDDTITFTISKRCTVVFGNTSFVTE